MVGGQEDLVPLAIVALGTLIVTIAAVIALLRSRRIPGLGATTGWAVEEVAAALLASRLELDLRQGDALQTPSSG